MKTFKIIIAFILFSLYGCGQENHNVTFFKDTEAYDLAKAIEKNDTLKIEKIVKANAKLLEVYEETSGANALYLALTLENFEAFKKLLDLGANPNSINPISKYSILIEAIKFYSKPESYTIEAKYVALLLAKGANPNYAVEKDFVDKKGHSHMAKSSLTEAAKLNLELVKLLIKAGANPYKEFAHDGKTPFGSALRGFKDKFIISNYFIDSLKVDVFAPLYKGTEDSLYIQDYVINKYTKAKLNGDKKTLTNLISENKDIDIANQEGWLFIKKLESLGVNFKDYKYKRE